MAENGKPKGLEVPAPASYSVVSNPKGKRDEDFIVITIGSTGKCLNRYEITKAVPNVKTVKSVEELASLTGTDGVELQAVINAAYRQIFGYRPPYQLEFDRDESKAVKTADPTNAEKPYVDYPLGSGGHAALQKVCDDYKPGTRAAATGGQKAKASKLDGIAAKYGIDTSKSVEDIMAELEAKIKKAKSGK